MSLVEGFSIWNKEMQYLLPTFKKTLKTNNLILQRAEREYIIEKLYAFFNIYNVYKMHLSKFYTFLLLSL